MLTAAEARKLIEEQNDDLKNELERIDDTIHRFIGNNERRVNYDLSERQELIEPIIDSLRERGFDVSWNRACLWLEISW